MLRRCCELWPFLRQIDHAEVEKLLLDDDETDMVDVFLKRLVDLDLVTLTLQFDGCTIVDARTLFDGGVENYFNIKERLRDRAAIV